MGNKAPANDLKYNQLIKWCRQHINEIPNLGGLLHNLTENRQLGHGVHAELVKRIHESGEYTITGVENSTGNYDIDIELDGKINIQVWFGQNTAGHIMESQFSSDGQRRNAKLENITPLGGVRTDWTKDEQVLIKKLDQLPNDKFSVLLAVPRFIGLTFLPEWWENIPNSKCVIKSRTPLDCQHKGEQAVIYYSDNFPYMDEAKKIIKAVGFNHKDENSMY